MGAMSHITLLSLVGLLFGMCSAYSVPKRESIDQVLMKAGNGSDAFNFNWDSKKHLARTEYDMIMTQDEWLMLHAPHHRHKRTAGIIPTRTEKRWPKNTLKYQLKWTDFNTNELHEIFKAFADLKHFTCLDFKETTVATHRVFISNGDGGCYSHVGQTGGVQVLGLDKNGCLQKYVVIHELSHALGMFHEQSRHDRDDHVTIVWDNIPDQFEYNFDKYGTDVIDVMNLPYDYHSLMHYGTTAGSSNGHPTIVTKDPQYDDVIGMSSELSFLDIKSLNLMYKCNENFPVKQCPGTGFVGKDGLCWCPGDDEKEPVKYCDAGDAQNGDIGTPGPVEIPTPPPCKDDEEYCAFIYPEYHCAGFGNARMECRKSCNTC